MRTEKVFLLSIIMISNSEIAGSSDSNTTLTGEIFLVLLLLFISVAYDPTENIEHRRLTC